MSGAPSVGGALHDQVAAAFVKVQEAMRPRNTKHGDDRLTRWLDAFEGDMRDVIAPHVERYIADPDTPEPVRQLFATMAEPSHATMTTILLAGVGALAFPLVSATVAGPAAVITQQSFHHLPEVVLTPAELALAKLRNNLSGIDAYDEAQSSGMNRQRFDVMALNMGDSLPIAEALLLYRRGFLDDARLLKAVRQSRMRDEWFDAVKALRYAPPPAGEVVAGRLKGHLSEPDYLDKLSEAGIDPINGEWMRQTAGRPYGIEQALHLLNRGEIDEARVRQVVAQSDVNPDFTDDILHLRVYVPPVRSTMAMLRAGAITDAQATALFHENGVRDVDIPGYLKEAHHTKSAAAKELTQAQTLRMYGAHYIDRADATARLVAIGYDAETIGLLLGFADEATRERFTNAVVTRIHTRYVAHKISAAEAQAALTADHVPASMITELMQLWNIERDATMHELTPAAIVGAYRREAIGAHETKVRLLAAGVDVDDLKITVAIGFPPSHPEPKLVQAVLDA